MTQSKPRYLTKSRFKVAHECPTKLAYLDDSRYGNKKAVDSFLKALAEGGFQVGELAKIYHPGGIEITECDHTFAAQQTAALLAQGPCILYEAAFLWEQLFIRVDVLIWNGQSLEAIEVKAKSFDPTKHETFFSKRPPKGQKKALLSDWEPYLIDIAFQTFVIQKSRPGIPVKPYLMLADKSCRASVDGLNQRFFLKGAPGELRRHVELAPGTDLHSVGTALLAKVDVREPVTFILSPDFNSFRDFEKYLAHLTQYLPKDSKHPPLLSEECKRCEFRIKGTDFDPPKLSGFSECWASAAKLSPEQLAQPLILDLWNFRQTQNLIDQGRYLLREIEQDDLKLKEGEHGLSASERQWLQVEKVKNQDPTPYFNLDGLRAEISQWRFPLHFIDFETTMVAIPFYKDQAPYEQIAFQFSHHILTADGRITHKDQYLFAERGKFPNFAFVRALRQALDTDQGTIFRYAAHENTVLCQIARQLEASTEPDAPELIAWIKTITQSPGKSEEEWEGPRNMVDLCELVKRYFYHPETHGSNSIKKVLPAVLSASPYLQDIYSRPIYGSPSHQSLNFENKAWIVRSAEGRLLDPYRQLEPIFSKDDQEALERIFGADELQDGGAAMTAYAMLQFTQMSETEAQKIRAALLRYCELDTLAMVMLVEFWMEQVGMGKKVA